jgi:hypothetical protein
MFLLRSKSLGRIGYLAHHASVSSKRLDTIADFSRHRYRLRVDCPDCNRVVTLDPLPIIQLCSERGWSKDMSAVQRRLKCGDCVSRDVRCGPAFGD